MKSTLGAVFRLIAIVLFFETFFVSFGYASGRSQGETTCESLKELYEMRFSIQQNPLCAEAFSDFKTKLTAAYNVCLSRRNETQVECNERGNTTAALQLQLQEIHAAIVRNPRELAQELVNFRTSTSMERLSMCVRRENGRTISRQDFTDTLNQAIQEFSPETRILRGNERRQRHDVPFQWMSRETKQAISTVAGALLWRARGGSIHTGSTHMARLIFATGGYGLLGWFNGGLDGAVAGGLTSAPLWIAGWGTYMDIGQSKKSKGEKGSALQDTAMMTLRGLFQTSLSGGYLMLQGYDGWALASGASMGPCYLGSTYAVRQNSWLVPTRTNSSGETSPSARWIDGSTAYGELCSGAMMGLGLSTTLQNGTTGNRYLGF